MTEEQKKNVRDIIRWQQIGCIVVALARKMQITEKQALDLFYRSNTSRRLHDRTTGLYLMSDLYILDDILREFNYKIA